MVFQKQKVPGLCHLKQVVKKQHPIIWKPSFWEWYCRWLKEIQQTHQLSASYFIPWFTTGFYTGGFLAGFLNHQQYPYHPWEWYNYLPWPPKINQIVGKYTTPMDDMGKGQSLCKPSPPRLAESGSRPPTPGICPETWLPRKVTWKDLTQTHSLED